MSGAISIIVPAHDEAACIDACLSALLLSDRVPVPAEIVVVANGCRDDTAARARAHAVTAAARGWRLQVIETPQGDKMNALNLGDRAARHGNRIYLDADVVVDPGLLPELTELLATDAPRLASGRPRVAPARSAFTRAYARFWTRLPFFALAVPGFGLFAVNAPGRARWRRFPAIISDDTFVRLHFAPSERIAASAGYAWPMVEGFRNLVRVRRRQDAGVREIARLYPALMANDDKTRPGPAAILRLALRDPTGLAAYAAVALAVRTPLFRSRSPWARGR